MKILVGVQPDEQGDDALACGEALARSMRADLVLAHVHPMPWRAHNEGGGLPTGRMSSRVLRRFCDVFRAEQLGCRGKRR